MVYRLSADAVAGEREGAPAGPRIRRREMPGKAEDRVYLPGRKDPVYLTRWPAARFLLQRVRDEAHRFAVAYHRKLKEKEDLRSLLDRIPGIGDWTAQYIAMRAMGEPDAFPAADLGIIKALQQGDKRLTPKQIRQRAEEWRPWRAYAAMHLWHG